MWNRLVNKFLDIGGDSNWILNGLNAAPDYFKFIARIS
jgi:hypothetical protein